MAPPYQRRGDRPTGPTPFTANISRCPVSGGQAVISDPEDAAVWNYLCSILPLEARQKLAEFNLFTDGTSNVLAYTSPIREEGVTDNTRFSISIDYFDVYDENGEKRDWSKLTYTILHEYGHVLLEDETQVDLTVGRDTSHSGGGRYGQHPLFHQH